MGRAWLTTSGFLSGRREQIPEFCLACHQTTDPSTRHHILDGESVSCKTQQRRLLYSQKRRRTKTTTIMTALATVAIAVFSVTEIGPQGSHAFSTDLSTTTRAKFYYLQQSEINGNNIGAVSSHRFSLSTLFAKVRRSGGGGGASKKSLNRKKKAQSNSRKGALLKSNKSQNSKKENTSPGLTSNSSPPPSAPSSPSGQRAPPWQVLSQKDAKKNIQREKKRREAIQEGRISPSVTSAQLFQEYGDDIDHDDDDFDAPMKVSSSFLNPADKALLGWKRFNPSTVSMRYVASVLDRQKLPRLGVPEVAFLGRYVIGFRL